jgi:iodotyrosine deiodinase
MDSNKFIPFKPLNFSQEETRKRALELREFLDLRRSIRFFSDKSVEKDIIIDIIMTASSAPSGAHKQPWTFCAISSESIKHKIREAAEEEEFISYNGRMSTEWLDDLKKFDTNHIKEFLDVAPWLIVVFKKSYDQKGDAKKKNYYVMESVGIAVGFLIAAIHNAGLVTLTHTPSPMNFLQNILNRPENEKPFLLLPVGYPAENTSVPDIDRKSEKDVIVFFE